MAVWHWPSRLLVSERCFCFVMIEIPLLVRQAISMR
jgi:hypothetical protein